MKQLSFDQAWIFYLSHIWETWDLEKIVFFQIYQKYLCVDLAKFIEGCKKYSIKWDFKQNTKLKRKIAKQIFYKKTGLKNPTMEDFNIPTKIYKLLEIDVYTAAEICNRTIIKKYEKNKNNKKS